MKDISIINEQVFKECINSNKYEQNKTNNNELSNDVSFLPLHRLNSNDELADCKALIEEVMNTGCFTSGPYMARVEEKIKNFYQATACISTSSGTDSLMIALKAIGIEHDDEVILPLNSFAATENAIMSVGGVPVFGNIDESFNLIPSEVNRLSNSRTKAVVPVCLYGSLANIKEIHQLAKSQNLKVVLDAAQCFGIKEAINYCDMLALSFNPFKNIGTFGKSGAVLTCNSTFACNARQYSYHGFVEGKKNVKAQNWGFNSRIDNMQAAILFAKLKHFESNALKRAKLALGYILALKNLKEHCSCTTEVKNNTWHLFPLLLKHTKREDLITFAKSRGVELDIYYPHLSHQGKHALAEQYPNKEQFKESENIHSRLVHLPLHNHMLKEEQVAIIGVIHEYFL